MKEGQWDEVDFTVRETADAEPEKLDVEIEGDDQVEDQPSKKDGDTGTNDKVTVEVDDDTPERDRGRKPAPAPEDPTQEELDKYSQKAQQRLKHFTKSYHDERAAKEEAVRERQAAEAFAKQQLDYAKKLQEELTALRAQANTATKGQAQVHLDQAKKAYQEAYEAGDSAGLLAAQEALFKAQLDLRDAVTAETAKPEKEIAGQDDTDRVYNQSPTPAQQRREPDPEAIAWQSQNPWFQSDSQMTQFAMGLHLDVTQKGQLKVNSPEYWAHIDKRMRQAYPDYDWGDDDNSAAQTPPAKGVRRAESRPAATVVAGAGRSAPTRKIRLTQSEVNIADRLNISYEDYARSKAQLAGE